MKTAKEWQEECGVPKETAEAIQRDAWESCLDEVVCSELQSGHDRAKQEHKFPGDR